MTEIEQVDIIIPVYNEADGIFPCLRSIEKYFTFPCRILICYDHDSDSTLSALKNNFQTTLPIEFVKNKASGVHGAIMTGLMFSQAPSRIVIPADDDYNAPLLNTLVEEKVKGADIVCPSRFMQGGTMQGCPFLKRVLVRTAAFFLYHFAGLPTHDPTNGFRLFSRKVIENINIQSKVGFAFSLEYLVKADRFGYSIKEIPAHWYERKYGSSNFKLFSWIPQYLVWFFYAFKTKGLKTLS